ncbi:hypothetical protein, partial [Bradyrhizobium sp.]|uniref:hypothetical protein n=1 Tax=Bradyrhizobium sp. TaxID=376 RepID=UPI0039E32DE9
MLYPVVPSSWPGLSRASTNPYHFLQDVDGRDKPGHDGKNMEIRRFASDSRDFDHQIGQALGRVEPARLAAMAEALGV